MPEMNKNLEWFIRKKDFIKINRIEQELDIPEGTLKKFVDGNRGLPENWHPTVIDWIRKFRQE
jgi:hypothetical protein